MSKIRCGRGWNRRIKKGGGFIYLAVDEEARK